MASQYYTPLSNGLQSFADASPDYEVSAAGIGSFREQASRLAEFGRHGDVYVVHAAEGETVVPTEVLDANPKVRELLFDQMRGMGLEPQEYVVGSELNSLNPVTGMPEFFFKKIFRGIKKGLKKVVKVAKKIAPIVIPLAASAFGIPFLGTAFGAGTAGAAALGAGIGSLSGGRSLNDSLKAAALAGGASVAFSAARGALSPTGTLLGGAKGSITGVTPVYDPQTGRQLGSRVAGSFGADSDNFLTRNMPGTQNVDFRTASARAASNPFDSFMGRQTLDAGFVPSAPTLPPANLTGVQGTQVASLGSVPETVLPVGSAPGDANYLSRQQALRNDSVSGPPRVLSSRTGQLQTNIRPQIFGGLRPQDQLPPMGQERLNMIDINRPVPSGGERQFLTDLSGTRLPNQPTIDAPQNIFDRAKDFGSGIFEKFGIGSGDANARALEASKIYKAEIAGLPANLQEYSGGEAGLRRYYAILADQNKGISPTALLAAATIGAPLIASLFSGDDEEDRASDISGFRKPNALLAKDPNKFIVQNLDPQQVTARNPQDLIVESPYTLNQGGLAQFPRKEMLVEGPGTEKSDDIPAMLSDGEFVLNARSVRGADPTGQGNRYLGAKNLYSMMRDFEMRA